MTHSDSAHRRISKPPELLKKRHLVGRILVALGLVASLVVVGANPSTADSGNLGQPEVVINPGGGVLPDGSDGLKYVMNSNGSGLDQIHFANTVQYCCSAATPMLNIGGQLYGQGGPAYSGQGSWDTLEIVGLTGSASSSGGTDTGNGSATLRYTVTHNELEYTLLRTVSYTHPNNVVTEGYEITIPEGNTEVVKFYLGGDTAPGSSDAGEGFMVTDPVRTVYSVNPNSGIQLGYGEIPGDVPFDGARAVSFHEPYATVQAGDDIGFVVDESYHDAGIMMQWTIGTDPGVHQRGLQVLVGERGASLTASWGTTEAEAGDTTSLSFSLINTGSENAGDISFTFDLPSGVAHANDPSTNSCLGTLTAAAGSITLTGASVQAGANCTVTIPVVAAAAGFYTIDMSSVSSSVGVENAVAASVLEVTGQACDRMVVGDYAGSELFAGSLARFYMAAFTRQPDGPGFDYWSARHAEGTTIREIAYHFLNSDEFNETYDAHTDSEFTEVIYGNLLCRASDEPGKMYWEGELSNGLDRKDMLLLFSESIEFQRLTGTA